MSANWIYSSDFGLNGSKAYKHLNRALGISLNSNSDSFVQGVIYKLELDDTMGFIYFQNIDNKDAVRNLLQTIADALDEEPNFTIMDNNTDEEIYV
jgi:hypothetical protein